MRKITLILGGIRSGKSYFAEQKAEYYSERPVYIATASVSDKEMKARIELHRKRRGDKYELIEVPYELTGPLEKLRNRTVLVDCLTLNLSNRLLATEEYLDLEELIETDEEYLEEIFEIVQKNNLNIIFVSNEVGCSPVEVNELGRYFQDLQGRWNRTMADYADEVYMVQAGIPALVKKKSCFPFRVGAPSYVLPTGYIENVTYLMDRVDDIQLLAFDSIPDDPLFKKEILSTLQYLAKDSGITYSVHMPVKPLIFENFEKKLHSTVEIIEKLQPLDIKSFTFHFDLPGSKEWDELTADEIGRINERYIQFFKTVMDACPGIDIALENTATPLSALDHVVGSCGISYCIDIGHLLVQGRDLSEIESRLEKTSMVHLHGWEEVKGKKQDHRAITFNREIFKLLEEFRGVLTIENYHKTLFEKSLETLKMYY